MLIKTNEEAAVHNNFKKRERERQTMTFNSIYFNYDLQQFKIIKN